MTLQDILIKYLQDPTTAETKIFNLIEQGVKKGHTGASDQVIKSLVGIIGECLDVLNGSSASWKGTNATDLVVLMDIMTNHHHSKDYFKNDLAVPRAKLKQLKQMAEKYGPRNK